MDQDKLEQFKKFPIMAAIDPNIGNIAHICANKANFSWLEESVDPPKAKTMVDSDEIDDESDDSHQSDSEDDEPERSSSKCKHSTSENRVVETKEKRPKNQTKNEFVWDRYTQNQRRCEQHAFRFREEMESAKKTPLHLFQKIKTLKF